MWRAWMVLQCFFFKFWNNYGVTAVAPKMFRRISWALALVSINGTILHNSNAIGKLGNRRRCSPQSLLRFNWFCEYVHMCSSVQFYCICVAITPLRTENWAVTGCLHTPSLNHTRFSSSTPHAAREPLICFNFVILRILHQWNQTVWNLLKWTFFHSVQFPWNTSRSLHVSGANSCLFLTTVSWYGCTAVCLTTQPLEDTRVVCSFELLQMKLLWMSAYRFSCERTFSLSEIITQECSCWVVWWVRV